MPTGKVKWFDCKKGFGFIVGPEEQDVFVHFTVIKATGFRRLRDGDTVEYEATTGPKGFTASWVRRLRPPNPSEDGVISAESGQDDESVGNR